MALPALSALASDGNRAAQVLLGLIDKSPALQGPYLSALGRADRLALMRAPGGMSGVNWMRQAAADVPLAALWLRLWAVDAPPVIVADFARAGEPRAARLAVLALLARQMPGIAAAATDPDFPPAMRLFVWQGVPGGTPSTPAEIDAIAALLPPGDPQREESALIDPPIARESWFASDRVGIPAGALCKALCPETFVKCSNAVFFAVGGYGGMVTLGSPVEGLVSTADFAASAKGQSTLLRQVLLRVQTSGQADLLARVAKWDACFASALTAEAARYD